MSQIYCSNCGQHIPEDSNYCRFCGAAQHGVDAAVYHAESPSISHSPASYVISQAQNQNSAATHQPIKQQKNDYIKKRHLCKEVKWSFFISYLGTTIVLPLLFLLGAFIYPTIFILIFLIYLIALYITASIVYDNFYFSIDETGFQKEHGVIHKHYVSIPYQQIQNVNITRSLLDRVLGLSRICIETAGSSGAARRHVAGGSRSKAEAHLPGMTIPEAKKIHDLLLEKANDFGRNV
jgi:membrane protein YdbS with pleckstrin-like domain